MQLKQGCLWLRLQGEMNSQSLFIAFEIQTAIVLAVELVRMTLGIPEMGLVPSTAAFAL